MNWSKFDANFSPGQTVLRVRTQPGRIRLAIEAIAQTPDSPDLCDVLEDAELEEDADWSIESRRARAI